MESSEVKDLLQQAYYYAEDLRLNGHLWDDRFHAYIKKRVVNLLKEVISSIEDAKEIQN